MNRLIRSLPLADHMPKRHWLDARLVTFRCTSQVEIDVRAGSERMDRIINRHGVGSLR